MSRRAPVPGLALALAAIVAGCPPSGPTPKGPDPAPTTTASTGAPTSGAPAADPLQGSVFTRDEVLAIYRAEHLAGLPGAGEEARAERDRVLRRHRLVDDQGAEVPARARAYERALEALANDEDGWAAFVETLPR